ncbi:universal stress protein [uncultured Muriicola sp.]|uniref:universal stress protein n=1 Tax=uncultured Muriicola sp. TaxID=1583102 RepID=UPI0026398E2B|nr:universal stress protein [uncultured Muriicola sp.]
MRKIVVPTDFSDNAYNALKYACEIFKYERSEICVIHAFADEVYQLGNIKERGLLDKRKDEVEQKTASALSELMARIKEYAPNPKHKYTSIAAFGSLIDEVNDLVERENIDIVVMGTRGAANDRSNTFGSNTLNVMKYVQCPVLAIPEDYGYHQPKELLFPSNYLIPYKRRELKLLCELTGSFRSTIHLLYIDPMKKLSLRQEDNRDFLKAELRKANLIFETTPEKDKTMAITKYIVHQNIDMLVMVNTRHSHLEDLLMPTTLNKLGLHLKIPFLVLQNLAR